MTRKFRFAVNVPGMPDATGWLDFAREAEALGYSTLQCADHYGMHDPLSILTAAAGVTSTIRLGPYVLCNDFRHPTVLARAGRDHRRAEWWPARARHRRGMEHRRVRARRSPVRSRGREARAPRGVDRRPARSLRRRAGHVRGSVLRRARPRRLPEAAAASVDPVGRRRERPAHARARGAHGRHRRLRRRARHPRA